MAPWRPWVRQQVLAAHAFSVSRALSKGSVQPLRLGRLRPGEWLDVHVAEAGHAHDLEDVQLQQEPAHAAADTVDAEIRGFNQLQNLLLSRRLRLHHPERCC